MVDLQHGKRNRPRIYKKHTTLTLSRQATYRIIAACATSIYLPIFPSCGPERVKIFAAKLSIYCRSRVVPVPGSLRANRSFQEEEMKKIYKTSLMAVALAIALCTGLTGAAFPQTAADGGNGTLAFDKLKTLVGRWEGTTSKGK